MNQNTSRSGKISSPKLGLFSEAQNSSSSKDFPPPVGRGARPCQGSPTQPFFVLADSRPKFEWGQQGILEFEPKIPPMAIDFCYLFDVHKSKLSVHLTAGSWKKHQNPLGFLGFPLEETGPQYLSNSSKISRNPVPVTTTPGLIRALLATTIETNLPNIEYPRKVR